MNDYEFDGLMSDEETMIIYVKVVSKDKTMLLEAGITELIGSIKERIGKKEMMATKRITLIHNGEELADGKSIEDYHIVDWSVVHAYFTPVTEFDRRGTGVGNAVPGWVPIAIEVKPWHTQEEIKELIENWTGLGFDEYSLFNGTRAYDNFLLGNNVDLNLKSPIFISVYPPHMFENEYSDEGFSDELEFEISVNGCGWKEDIKISRSWSVYDVKKLIKKVDEDFYFSKDMIKLDDEQTLGFLGFLGFVEKPIIWSLSLKMIKLSIKMPQVGNGETLVLETYSANTIGEIKRKICAKMGIPCNSQNLYCMGTLLVDYESLGMNNIGRNSVIYAIFGSGNEVDEEILNLSVIRTGEKSFGINVKPYYTILNVKTVIESLCDIPICVQHLSYCEKLKDWKTVKECGIKDGCGIGLRINGKYVKILINTPHGEKTNSLVIEAKNSDLVNAIMDMIPREEMEYIKGKPCLFGDGVALSGNKRIGMYGSSIFQLDGLIEINVTRPDGVIVKVELNSYYSINAVKEKVEEICGIPIELQRLTYRGDDVHNNETLGRYEYVLGSLWVLKWEFRNSFWSFFWPCYKGK